MLDAVDGVTVQAASTPQVRTLSPRRFLRFAVSLQDACSIYAALIVAYWARYAIPLGPSVRGAAPFSAYQGVAILLLGIMMPTLFLKGAYRPYLKNELFDELATIFSAATMSVAGIIVVTFLMHEFEYSRGVIIYLWISLICLPALGRILFRGCQVACYRRGIGVRRLLVVGASDSGKMIMQSVRNRRDLGYEVVGFVDRRSRARVPDFGRFPRLGTIGDIPELLESQRVDEVVVALPGSAHEEVSPIVRLCEQNQVGLKLIPDLFEMTLSQVQMDSIAGLPLLDVQEQPARRVARVAKRALDIGVAGAVLCVSFLLIAVLALLIRLDSEGPIFIKQERVGKDGRRFTCWKLRSMYVGADDLLAVLRARNEAQGPIFKMRRDPRVTRIGRYLRRFSLDELPQAWNVLRGDMSLVGPRPPLPSEVEKYEPWQRRRLEVTPGITGMWQVSGRSNLAFDEMVIMDISYIDNWSLSLDLKVLLRTVRAVVSAHGAY